MNLNIIIRVFQIHILYMEKNPNFSLHTTMYYFTSNVFLESFFSLFCMIIVITVNLFCQRKWLEKQFLTSARGNNLKGNVSLIALCAVFNLEGALCVIAPKMSGPTLVHLFRLSWRLNRSSSNSYTIMLTQFLNIWLQIS